VVLLQRDILTDVNSSADRSLRLIQIKPHMDIRALNVERQEGKRESEGSMKLTIAGLAGAALMLAAAGAQAQDVSAAEALMKKSGCLKCHSVSAKKEGPPFKETAAKYKGKADAEAALFKHLTTNPKVKVDGKEELHDNLKTKNEADVKNVVKYILTR
jgi:cytochrome c